MTASRRRARLALVALGASAAVAAVAVPAQAVHWPFFGGDSGRSGYQPLDEGVTPLTFAYRTTTPVATGGVVTSPLTTAGNPATQRLIYGIGTGNVLLRRLDTGAAVGDVNGVQVANDATADLDVFGNRGGAVNRASVSFADTSGATLGQVFVVHNEDDAAANAPDIEIAQIDETTGVKKPVDVDVANTDGYTIDSSAVATGAAADGSRTLFFVAHNDALDEQRLFRVSITGNAATTAAVVNGATATRTDDIGATPDASPALGTIDGVARLAVGTATGVSTFAAADLVAGPTFTLPGGATVAQTPSIPVQPNGTTPGAGQAVTTAPFLYVAAQSGGGTQVFKVNANTPDTTLTVAGTSPVLAGAPAPALAITQESEPTQGEGKVVVTTGANLYLLSTAGLDLAGQFDSDGAPTLTAGVDGYAQTTAAASGDLIFVTNDSGLQQVLRLEDAKSVTPPASQFPIPTTAPDVPTLPPGGGAGQPSSSRGFIQYPTPSGLYVYKTTDADAPTVALTAPANGATVSGPGITLGATAADFRGITSVTFRLNGQPVGSDAVPDSGSPFLPGAGAAFSATLNTTQVPNGNYVLDAVASDGTLTTTSAPRNITINNGPGAGVGGVADDRPPAVAFTAPGANAVVRSPATVSANASDDKGIASVRFSVGDRVVCTDTTAPYSCAAAFTGADVGRNSLFAVATDSAGQTGSAVRVVRVDRFTPKGVSAKVSPTRDRRAPYRFRTSGTVSLPTGVTRTQGCGDGVVSVQVKRGSTTLSTRRSTLSRTCTYSSTVTFANRRRLGSSGRLKITARFLGNDVLKRRDAASRSVRAG